MNTTVKNHIHYALYSAIILAVLVTHGSRPIDSTNSKLTIALMGLLILGESVVRVVRAALGKGGASSDLAG